MEVNKEFSKQDFGTLVQELEREDEFNSSAKNLLERFVEANTRKTLFLHFTPITHSFYLKSCHKQNSGEVWEGRFVPFGRSSLELSRETLFSGETQSKLFPRHFTHPFSSIPSHPF